MFTRELFDLQFSFAERVQAVSGMPLERALLQFTNFYVRFGLGREHDAEHGGWRAYLDGLRSARDGREWTYRFYLNDAEANTMPVTAGVFGCFSYTLLSGNVARLHFRNRESDGVSPLSPERRGARRAELALLFARVKASVGDSSSVKGGSWLYNLDAYRQLFPDAYTASRKPVPARFQSMSLWGQLLDHRGQVKPTMRQSLLDGLEACSTLEGLSACFPFSVLEVQAPLHVFCELYGV